MLRLTSVFSVGVLLGVACVGLLLQSRMHWVGTLLMIASPLLVIASALPFMVLGYTLTNDAILVRRLGWTTRLPLSGLKSVSGDAEALQRAIRIFGNGGLFSFTGEFWSRRLGRFRVLATDLDRAVVLRYPRRTIVITPHDPQHFIMRARTLMKSAAAGWG